MHFIVAKNVAFKLLMKVYRRKYLSNIINNAYPMSALLMKKSIKLTGSETENYVMLVGVHNTRKHSNNILGKIEKLEEILNTQIFAYIRIKKRKSMALEIKTKIGKFIHFLKFILLAHKHSSIEYARNKETSIIESIRESIDRFIYHESRAVLNVGDGL